MADKSRMEILKMYNQISYSFVDSLNSINETKKNLLKENLNNISAYNNDSIHLITISVNLVFISQKQLHLLETDSLNIYLRLNSDVISVLASINNWILKIDRSIDIYQERVNKLTNTCKSIVNNISASTVSSQSILCNHIEKNLKSTDGYLNNSEKYLSLIPKTIETINGDSVRNVFRDIVQLKSEMYRVNKDIASSVQQSLSKKTADISTSSAHLLDRVSQYKLLNEKIKNKI
jgi:hypothetical protein